MAFFFKTMQFIKCFRKTKDAHKSSKFRCTSDFFCATHLDITNLVTYHRHKNSGPNVLTVISIHFM